jgi:hypothetical protein
VAFIIGALSLSGVTKWLAGIAARQYIDGFHAGEIQGRDVAEVGNVGVVVCQDGRGRFVVLHMPGDIAA